MVGDIEGLRLGLDQHLALVEGDSRTDRGVAVVPQPGQNFPWAFSQAWPQDVPSAPPGRLKAKARTASKVMAKDPVG